MRQCLIFGKSALWKQRYTCHCNCRGKAAESPTGFRYYYFIRQRATSPKGPPKKRKPMHQQHLSRVQWFQRREMQSCKLQRNHNFLADAQLPRGAQAPQNLQTHKGTGSTYRDAMHFAVSSPPPFFFLFAQPHLRGCFRKARMQDGLIRIVLLAKRINSRWHFDVANSHHRNPLMLLGVGAEFVWEGCTVQHAGEELGRG